jgi:hypothetical protein
MQIGSKVRLKIFNGNASGPPNVSADANFWSLVGSHGTVIETRPIEGIDADRVLVLFDVSLPNLRLPNHNELKNSLWIKRSDLVIFQMMMNYHNLFRCN